MKRFDIISEPGEPPREDENGDWVKYEDCMEAERELVELREEKHIQGNFTRKMKAKTGLRYGIQNKAKPYRTKRMRYKMKFNINELTVGEVKEIAALFNGYSQREVINEESVYGIGETWFIRTVTHHLVGEVKRVTDKEIILKGGTVLWVADDGRFTEAIKTGKFSETEVYGEQDVVIGRGSVIDGTRLKVNIEIAQR